MKAQYTLLDSGDMQKLEQFGPFRVVRPCSQAIWRPFLSSEEWKKADAHFSREGGNNWKSNCQLPKEWTAEIQGIHFKIAPTDFGHLGVFPEHSMLWKEMTDLIQAQKSPPNVLNLFAYSGGATLAAAKAGAKVCHLDASKGMVSWARENAQLNQLQGAPIRWIVDDVIKFLKRESRRGVRYDGIILDPPSFGRGSQGEVFKIERDVHEILKLCSEVLSESPLFVFFTTHTPGMTPLVMRYLLSQMMDGKKGKISSGEMIIPAENGCDLPSGSYARWTHG
ncbi:MAG: class I SAM-dependent methyltransferase [Parachlamydiales bacterium]|nr:class I SAM-dependent methyltransferase [Candidatus Acheromyda pituitae]